MTERRRLIKRKEKLSASPSFLSFSDFSHCLDRGCSHTAAELHGNSRLYDCTRSVDTPALAAHDLDEVHFRSPLLPALHQAEGLLVDSVDRERPDALGILDAGEHAAGDALADGELAAVLEGGSVAHLGALLLAHIDALGHEDGGKLAEGDHSVDSTAAGRLDTLGKAGTDEDGLVLRVALLAQLGGVDHGAEGPGVPLVEELQVLVDQLHVGRAAARRHVAGSLALPPDDLVGLMLSRDGGALGDLDDLVEACLDEGGLDLGQSAGELALDGRSDHGRDLLALLQHLQHREETTALGDGAEGT